MDYNYHTHTFRCSHAIGTEEEYICSAINSGIKYMGFSEHAPFAFDDGHESGHRVPMSQAEDYFKTLYALREKYKDKIEIKIGFEMEYYPLYFKKMLNTALDFGAEYLILGQHFLYNEYPDGKGVRSENPDDLREYVSCVTAAVKTGYFTYVAHPDMFFFGGDNEVYEKEMRKICIASKEFNVPLEINFLGIRDNRNYPDKRFWKIAGEVKCPVTFGFDAHDSLAAGDINSLKKAESLVKEFELNYIGRPKIINIQK